MTCVRCETCSGSGVRPLSVIETDTFSAVGSDWCTTAEIAKRVSFPRDIKLQALANRLVRLEQLGLLERRPLTGREFEWRTARTKARKVA